MTTLVAAAVPPARADGPPEPRLRAQELLDRGNQLFRDGDMRGALKLYRDAHDAFASPKLFFNIARCEEAVEERAPAMRDFARFLEEAPDAAAEVRGEAQERVRALATVLTVIDITGPPNAAVQLDGSRMGLTPLKGPLWAEPGLHNLTVQRTSGPPWVTTVVGRAGQRVSVSVPEAMFGGPGAGPGGGPGAGSSAGPVGPVAGSKGDPPLPGPPTTPPDGSTRRWWLWTGIAVVLLGGAVAAFLILRDPCPETKCS